MTTKLPVTVVTNSESGTATVTCPHYGCSARVEVFRESRPYSRAHHIGDRPLSFIHDEAVVEFHEFLVHWVDTPT